VLSAAHGRRVHARVAGSSAHTADCAVEATIRDDESRSSDDLRRQTPLSPASRAGAEPARRARMRAAATDPRGGEPDHFPTFGGERGERSMSRFHCRRLVRWWSPSISTITPYRA
jgi:hypothetical protein